jgi:hypothetical protein
MVARVRKITTCVSELDEIVHDKARPDDLETSLRDAEPKLGKRFERLHLQQPTLV